MSGILGSNALRRKVAGFIPATLWAILVLFLSLSNVTIVQKFEWTDIAGFDKMGHAVFHGVLALWVMYGFFGLQRRFRHMALWTMIACILFGVVIEFLQAWMRVGRQFEYLDMLANVAGIFIAYCIFNRFLKPSYYGSL